MSDFGFSLDDRFVRGDLFTESGKWKYTVVLDYRNEDYTHYDLWGSTRRALRDATKNNLSGVTFTEIPPGWTLVVLDPWGKNSHPISVKAERGMRMAYPMTEQEFVDKVDYEGGFSEAIFEYGLTYHDVEPGRVRDMLYRNYGLFRQVKAVRDAYYDYEETL